MHGKHKVGYHGNAFFNQLSPWRATVSKLTHHWRMLSKVPQKTSLKKKVSGTFALNL
jgi:hypothetical protein